MQRIFLDGAEANKLNAIPFKNDKELQNLLVSNPALVSTESEPELAVVLNELKLKNIGIADILLVDSSGLPVIVEAKLNKNFVSSRDIVGQVFDYARALSKFSIEEFNDVTGGKLKSSLEKLTSNAEEFKAVWKNCESNLGLAKTRIVYAVDEAAEDLKEIIQFINDHTDFEVRLVSYMKYQKDSFSVIMTNMIILGSEDEIDLKSLPVTKPSEEKTDIEDILTVESSEPEVKIDFKNLPVVEPSKPEVKIDIKDLPPVESSEPTEPISPTPTQEKSAPPTFKTTIETYKIIADDDFEITREEWNCGIIQVENWSPNIIYVFTYYEDDSGYGIEIRLDDDDVKNLDKTLLSFVPVAEELFPLAQVIWDSSWSNYRGKLIVKYTIDAPPEMLAKTMKELIQFTFKAINSEIKR